MTIRLTQLPYTIKAFDGLRSPNINWLLIIESQYKLKTMRYHRARCVYLISRENSYLCFHTMGSMFANKFANLQVDQIYNNLYE